MPTLVVPFRGADGKRRLGLPAAADRAAVSRAMLADVVAACAAVGPTLVVTPEPDPVAGATVVADPGPDQGAAVEAGLAAAAATVASPRPAADRTPAPVVVVNADLPCVTPADLLALAAAAPPHGLAIALAADGTTNALALASAALFTPVYGPGSAARFAALGPSRLLELPNLVDDVDTVADLERLESRLGRHTRSVLASLRAGAAT
jgi:2-phospho-L-lactate guanylyltransferase